MKATTERIFANDIQMMLWQEKNCCRCTKAINTSKATVYKCALQRDMECQKKGLWQINGRSVKLVKGIDVCPLMKPKETIIPCVDAPVIDAHEFAKGKPIEQPKQEEAPKKEVTQTFSDAEIKAAEKRMFDTIWNNEIAPNVGNAIKNVQAPMSEARFKELARRDAQTMLDTFTWEENMMIAFVPLIIANLALFYVQEVLDYCAANRLSEVKKLGRAVKEIRQRYVDDLKKDLDSKHLARIEEQTRQFKELERRNFMFLWFGCNQQIKKVAPDMDFMDMRTNAYCCIMMFEFLKRHNRMMDKVIAAKMGQSHSIDNPQIAKLAILMDAYFPDGFKVEVTPNIDICLKALANQVYKIEFGVEKMTGYKQNNI